MLFLLLAEHGRVYTSVLTDEMLAAEMSKKEQKRWQAARRNPAVGQEVKRP